MEFIRGKKRRRVASYEDCLATKFSSKLNKRHAYKVDVRNNK